MNTLTKVTEVTSLSRTFLILRDEEKRFWGIERKNIVNGKLAVELNGISGFMDKDINVTINRVIDQTKVDKLMEDGMDCFEAVKLVINERFGVK